MIGYEARARLTTDVADFVAGQRSAAQAAAALATSVQTLNTQLIRTHNLAEQAAAGMTRIAQSASRTGQQQRSAADSASVLNQAMQQGAQAYGAAQAGANSAAVAMERNAQAARGNAQAATNNAQAQQRSSQSLQAMGRELDRLRATQERYQALVRTGATLNRDQQESYDRVNQRIGTLTQRYLRLDSAQREQVRSARELAQANRLATQGIQEQSAAQVRLNQTSALSSSQLSQMGREVTRLTAQREALEGVQRQGIALNQQETNSLEAVRGRLRELAAIYARLTTEQKQAFTTARQLAQANQALASSARTAAQATQAQTRAAGDLNSSLWSLRSAVGDATGAMSQLWGVSTQVTRALWDNYSAQEMAIAQIARVSNTSASMLDQIVTRVRQLSTEIPIAFEELGEIAMLGSQVGVADDALSIFTETVALFAATSEVSADETSTMMARIMEMTNLVEDRGWQSVQNLGSSIAYLGSNALATDREILKTVESISTMTTQVGFSAESTIGLGAAMASLVIRPEIARGASQRVFLQLGEAIQGTGTSMERLTEITGMSQDALLELSQNDFEQYFFTVMEALGGVADRGGDLIPIIRELGILNTRDAEVVARLASNYDILSSSVGSAHENFENGQYLYEESERIFNTLTARVQILANTWSNFLFSAVEAIAPFLTSLVDATINLIDMADAMGAAPIVGWGALILGVVGTLALLASGIGFVSQGLLAFRGLLNMTTGAQTAQAAATTAQTAATARATAAQTAYQISMYRGVAASGAMMTSVAASGTAMQIFAARTAVATTAMRGFIMATPVGVILGIAAALAGAYLVWDQFSDSTEKANEALLKSQDAHINAAGGMDALRNALESDTQVWMDARDSVNEHVNALGESTSAYSSSAEEIIRSSRFRTVAIGEMSDADRQAAEEAENLSNRQSALREELGTASETADSTANSLSALGESASDAAQAGIAADNSIGQINGTLDNTAQAAENSAMAVGLATRQWAALSLESAIVESNLLSNEEVFKQVEATGVDFGKALTMEMMEAGRGAEYLRENAASIRDEFSMWDEVLTGLNEFTSNMVWDGWKPFTSDSIEAANSLEEFAANLDASTISMEEAARETSLLNDMFVQMPDGTRASIEQIVELTGETAEAAAMTEVMAAEVDGLGVSIETLHEAFTGFYDPLSAWDEALSEVNAGIEEQNAALREQNQDLNDNQLALQSQYDGLLQVEGGFSLYLDKLEESNQAQANWIENLTRLGMRGDIPADVIAGLTEMGADGAEIVAGLANANDEEVARFVASWDMGMGASSEMFTVMFSDFLSQAMTTGDTAGLEFVQDLMERFRNGQIEWNEVVDEITAYAEEEIQNADTTNQPTMDNTAALKELTNLIRQVEGDIAGMDDTVEPEVDTKPFWKHIGDWFASAWRWWQRNVVDAFRVRIDMITNQSTSGGRGYADGGWIQGPGGPRADKVPIMASDDEFMVNAASAARWGPLLEWINSDEGKLPSSRNYVPQMPVDDNIRRTPPTSASRVRSQPDFAQMASAGVRSFGGGERIVLHINNHYPQAEPTSVTTNRALQYVAGLNGVL